MRVLNPVPSLRGFSRLVPCLPSRDCPAAWQGGEGVHWVTAASLEPCQRHLVPQHSLPVPPLPQGSLWAHLCPQDLCPRYSVPVRSAAPRGHGSVAGVDGGAQALGRAHLSFAFVKYFTAASDLGQRDGGLSRALSWTTHDVLPLRDARTPTPAQLTRRMRAFCCPQRWSVQWRPWPRAAQTQEPTRSASFQSLQTPWSAGSCLGVRPSLPGASASSRVAWPAAFLDMHLLRKDTFYFWLQPSEQPGVAAVWMPVLTVPVGSVLILRPWAR